MHNTLHVSNGTLIIFIFIVVKMVSFFQILDLGLLFFPIVLVASYYLAKSNKELLISLSMYGWIIISDMNILFDIRMPSLSIFLLYLSFILLLVDKYKIVVSIKQAFILSLFMLIFILHWRGVIISGYMENNFLMSAGIERTGVVFSFLLIGLFLRRINYKKLLHYLIICFIVYILYIPLDVYLDKIVEIVYQDSKFNVGLSYRLLNANTLSQGAIIPVIAYISLKLDKSVKIPMVETIISLFALIIIFLSGSRQGMLAVLIIFLYVVMRNFNIKNLLRYGIIIAIIFMSFLTSNIGSKYKDLLNVEGYSKVQSFSYRFSEIVIGLENIGDNILTGHGFGGFRKYNLDREMLRTQVNSVDDSYVYEQIHGVHNYFFQLLFETGLIGLASFLIILKMYLYKIKRFFYKDTCSYYFLYMVFITMIVFQNISGGYAIGAGGLSTFLFFLTNIYNYKSTRYAS